jgi:HSP90 family molecular chaperone
MWPLTFVIPSNGVLKADGNGTGLQGEFGIGLLSFWTVGDSLTMTSTSADQKAYPMTMSKGDSRSFSA